MILWNDDRIGYESATAITPGPGIDVGVYFSRSSGKTVYL